MPYPNRMVEMCLQPEVLVPYCEKRVPKNLGLQSIILVCIQIDNYRFIPRFDSHVIIKNTENSLLVIQQQTRFLLPVIR